jgi:succinoglycan biosynthesis transport protein ExoP
MGFIGRQYPVIAFSFLVFFALGAVYVLTSPARYTGHATLVIGTQVNQLFQQQSAFADAPTDPATVDTQIEILRSEILAAAVIKDLHLTNDPEFIAPYPGFVGTIIDRATEFFSFGSSGTSSANEMTSDERLMRTAIWTLESHLSVRRVGLTYAIDIDYQSLSPDRAAQVANAVADAYVVDKLEAKFQTTRRAAIWLQDRLKELQEQSANADRAVNEFKQKNGIVDSGGSLLNDQQLAELNSALIQAQAKTAEAKARLDRVMEIVQKDNPDLVNVTAGTVTDTLHNDVITKLRQQYLDLAAKETDWTKRYGTNHLAVVNVRTQMLGIRRNILDELKRIAESYKSDYEIAKAREESVQKSLTDLVAQSQNLQGAQVTLRSLESRALTSRTLYDNFLQRYMESVQQQSFPVSDARLITAASRPSPKSAPRTSLVLALASLAGLMFGAGVGFLREIADRVFRTTSQIKEHLNIDCLAVVPLIKPRKEPFLGTAFRRTGRPRRVTKVGNILAGALSPPVGETLNVSKEYRLLPREDSLLRIVVDAPFSRFTESIRALKVAADLNRISKPNKVIGITSSLPNEGKSTVATTLAQIIAHSGSRALLIDCDLRNPSLTRKLAPDAQAGLLEVIAGETGLDEVIWSDSGTRLSFLPAVAYTRLAHSSEVLSSEATKKLFEALREAYDYIILDLSPLAPVVDVRAVTSLVDSFLFVVEWGRTKIDVVEHCLAGAIGVYENVLGVVLNKADMAKLSRYESYRGKYYHNRYYARYGYTD